MEGRTTCRESKVEREGDGADVKPLALEGADHADTPFFQEELWQRIIGFFKEKLGNGQL